MPELRLTEHRIHELPVPTEKEYERYWDTDVTGLCVKVLRSGKKKYDFKDRLNGKVIWGKNLPRCAETTLAEMRNQALQWLALIRGGENPWQKEEMRQTVYELCQMNLEDKRRQRNPAPLSPTTLRWYERLVEEIHKSKLGAMIADEVGCDDAWRFLRRFRSKARYHDSLRFFLSNSFKSAPQPLPNFFETVEKRYSLPNANQLPRFTDEDIERLCRFLRKAEMKLTKYEYNPIWINFIWFLIRVGTRPTETLLIQREWIKDVDGQAVIWHPSTKTGFRPILLSCPAMNIVTKTPRQDGNPFLFTGKMGHLKTYAKNFARLAEEAQLPHRCPYAIRRWFARTGRLVFKGDIGPITELGGWQSEAMALRYAGDDEEVLENVVMQRSDISDAVAARIDEVVGSQLPNKYGISTDIPETRVYEEEFQLPNSYQIDSKDTEKDPKGPNYGLMQDWLKATEEADLLKNVGSGGGIRTPDQLINSQLPTKEKK